MRKRALPFLLLACLFAIPIFAQHPCGYDFLFSQLQYLDPEFPQTHQSFIKSHSKTTTASYRDDEIYTIPVVVHVLWKETFQNIPDQRILDQLEALNNDFGQRNEDHTQLRPEFADIGKDARIQFYLVEIIRVHTDSIFDLSINWDDFSIQYPEHIKQSKAGGSDPWDPLYFLNIWVAPIKDDLFFGYAYPPPGLSNWPENSAAPTASFDGIVINYKAFGIDLPPYVTQNGEVIELNGRTLVHEMGHYLGLPHPWGNFPIDQDGCTFDDGIDDTPICAIPSFFDCDLSKNSCFAHLEDLPDMVENFMDYSSDHCRVSFTRQQVAVMRAVLENHRKDLRLIEQEDRFADEIVVYPNPCTGSGRIYLRKEIKSDYRFRFRTFDRRILPIPVVRNVAEPGLSYSFDISHLPDGLYLLELETTHWRFAKKILLLR